MLFVKYINGLHLRKKVLFVKSRAFFVLSASHPTPQPPFLPQKGALERLTECQGAFAAYPHSLRSLRYSTVPLTFRAFAIMPPCGEGKEIIRLLLSLHLSALYRKRRKETSGSAKKNNKAAAPWCCRSLVKLHIKIDGLNFYIFSTKNA